MSTEDKENWIVPLLYDAKYRLDNLGVALEYPFVEEKLDYGLAAASVLASLPVPDELTPWAQILDFREEYGKSHFLPLRRFLSRAHLTYYSMTELRDELETDIYSAESALQRAKLKYRTAKLELCVVSAVSIIENLLKLKWSELVKPVFAIEKARQEFLTAEAKVAESAGYYVVKAREAFGSSS